MLKITIYPLIKRQFTLKFAPNNRGDTPTLSVSAQADFFIFHS